MTICLLNAGGGVNVNVRCSIGTFVEGIVTKLLKIIEWHLTAKRMPQLGYLFMATRNCHLPDGRWLFVSRSREPTEFVATLVKPRTCCKRKEINLNINYVSQLLLLAMQWRLVLSRQLVYSLPLSWSVRSVNIDFMPSYDKSMHQSSVCACFTNSGQNMRLKNSMKPVKSSLFVLAMSGVQISATIWSL